MTLPEPSEALRVPFRTVYSQALSPGGRQRWGCFPIEGTRLHERALRANRSPLKVLAADSYGRPGREADLLASLGQAGVRVERAPDVDLEPLLGGRTFGAVLGLVPLPEEHALTDLVAKPGARLMVLVDVTDPGNVGALIRTAHAGGARALIAIGRSDPFHPKAVRASMGSVFKLPLLRAELPALFDTLHSAGVRTVAATTAGQDLRSFTPDDGAYALVLGSEAHGLERAGYDAELRIPMPAGVDSYSVNAAAAILLYALQTVG